MHVNGEAHSMTKCIGRAYLVVVFKSCHLPEMVDGTGLMPRVCELRFHHIGFIAT